MRTIGILIFALLLSFTTKSQNVERYMQYHDKGRMLILEGKYKDAVPYLDTAIQIMPYYPTIFLDRAYANMQLKKYKEALPDLDHVLNKKPYMTDARLQRGMALYHLGRLNEAENDLLEVQRSNPSKSREVEMYLDHIHRERQDQIAKNQEYINQMRNQVENERIHRARHREEVIWNTVVPLAFWTTVFLTW